MSFLIYDIILLAAFLIFSSVFLYTRRENLKKDGLLFLYRTKWGIKLINKVGKKYKKSLYFLSYISIITGYFLMFGILWLIYRLIKIYAFQPAVVRAIKIPPILPLVPYIDKIAPNLGLPSFYFIYFIIIIAIIAISHEFAHGIFMRRYNIKIKSTGFAFFPWFLPIFPAAFVEQDEKSMNRTGKFEQMAVLSAGTFANVITAVLFFIFMTLFFSFAFFPSGISFDSYATSQVALSSITSVGGISLNNPTTSQILENINENGLTKIKSNEKIYLANKQIIESQINSKDIILYWDSPALSENLSSVILKIDGKQILSIDDLKKELSNHKPGDKIIITNLEEKEIEKEITLAEHPEKQGVAWLGIGFMNSNSGLIRSVIEFFSFKKQNIHYSPKLGEFGFFVYNLFWWMVLISISVALINMLPMGIFDGGRFFYLTILGITGNKKIAEKAFRFSTSFFLFLLFLIMFFWAVSWWI